MRKGDYVFIIWAGILSLPYVVVPLIILIQGDELKDGIIPTLVGEYLAYLLIWVGVPWAVYNFISNRRAKKKQMELEEK